MSFYFHITTHISIYISPPQLPGGEGCDIFALPSTTLHHRERLRCMSPCPASPFYSLLATDFSLLLVDSRYPNMPVGGLVIYHHIGARRQCLPYKLNVVKYFLHWTDYMKIQFGDLGHQKNISD